MLKTAIEMGIMDIIKLTDSMVGKNMIESPFRGDFQTFPLGVIFKQFPSRMILRYFF